MTRKVLLPFLLFFNLLWLSTVLYGQVTVWEWNPPGGAGTGNSSWSDLNANWTQISPAPPPILSLPGSRLEWRGLGDPSSFNNIAGNTYKRLSFFGPQSYTLSGNQVTLSDATAGASGMVESESPEGQNILFPIIFNDATGKAGIINTKSTGRLTLTGVSFGSNTTGLIIYGENTEGVITFSGVLSGSKAVEIGSFSGVKNNTRVVFSGNNTLFTGGLTLSAGVLNVQDSAALGQSLSNPVMVMGGATLEVAGGLFLSKGRNIAISGNGVGSTGAIRNVLGSNTILSEIFLMQDARIGNDVAFTDLTLNKISKQIGSPSSGIIFSGIGNILLNSNIGTASEPLGGDFRKEGSGILTITKPCYYTGGTILNSGSTLKLAAANLLPVANLTLRSGATFRAAAAVDSIGYSQTFKTLNLQHNSTIVLGTGNHNLTFASSSSLLWAENRRLTIQGWKGLPGVSGTSGFGKVFFGNSPSGLTDPQLAQITFAGFCDGAMLLPNGELVPAIKPFIETVTTSGGPSSGVAGFSGFVGATITIAGCLFGGATQVEIGSTLLLPSQFTLVNSSKITFILGKDVEGFIKITTEDGDRTSPTPLSNLGYITKEANLPWGNLGASFTWLGDLEPPPDQPVSINHNNIEVDKIVSPLNPSGPPLVNPLTIYDGSLMLGGSDRLPANTPIVLVGGVLRLYNFANATPPDTDDGNGYSQTFDTLTLKGSASIAFGNTVSAARPAHEIRFNASKLVKWTEGAVLTILNWDGPLVGSLPGNKTKIFVGTDANSLTRDQLRQIRFAGRCQGAKILSTGELVPAESPFISTVVSDPTPGSSFLAYYGAKIILSGCKFEDVEKIKIGTEVFNTFNKVDNSGVLTIEFTYQDYFPVDTVYLITNEVPSNEGFSAGVLSPAGYATGVNGSWKNTSTWLGNIPPKAASKVTVRNNLDIADVTTVHLDTVLVNNGANLVLQDNGLLNINKEIINSGNISAAGNGVINMENGSILTNNNVFSMNGAGTVNFLSNGVIGGSQRITFNNLWINSGILTLPNTNLNDFSSSMVPTVMGEFRIKGGKILAADGLNSSTYGPRFGPSASLVYASGVKQWRSREWFSLPVPGNPSFPIHVVVEDNTTLIMDGGPLPPSGNLVCGGNFIIRKGLARVDITKPLEIMGDLQLGENAGSIATLNMGRINSEKNDVTPASARPDFVDNYLILHGNLIVYSGSSYNPRNNTRPFHFVGTGNSYLDVPGANPPTGSPAISLNNVHFEKNGILTLKSSLGITDSILLTSGYLSTESGKFLQIAAGAKIKGGSQNAFVAGELRKVTAASPANASGDFTFPIGEINGSSYFYRPVSIANLTHSGTTTYSAEFNATQTDIAPFDPIIIDSKLVGWWKNEWWVINKTGAGMGRVGIPYVTGKTWTTTPIDPKEIGVVRYTGDSWEFTKEGYFNGGNPYPEYLLSTNTGMVYSDIIGTFSPFTVGWAFVKVLSINLLYFTGTLSGNDALVKWKIAQTEDLKHFIVEHSNDGRNFAALGTVLWQENKEFSWRDINPGTGVHYYRLQMVEKSGAKSYSRVEMLQIGVNHTIIAGLVQNPISGGTAILDIYSAQSQTAEITLFDMSGRLVFRQQLGLWQGKNNPRLSLLPLAAGQYRMLIRTRDGVDKQLAVTRL